MLRNRGRRPFTVEAKSNGQTRFVSIPSKLPREAQKRAGHAEAAALWPSLEAAASSPRTPSDEAAPEHRRILPSLLVAEVPEPEAEPVIEPEVLARVRRVAPPSTAPDGAPRRRGRPRKVPIPNAVAVVEPAVPEPPQPVTETAPLVVSRRRSDRPGSETLRLGERWKRRLPRVCW
ncbi:DNA-binding protein [Methylobacterium sp. Leaf123]|nr:DNA-binding protein [Methylobacterium sp. Leaf123]